MRSFPLRVMVSALMVLPGLVEGYGLAATIYYQPVDLPDTGGGDAWRYVYHVRDFSFSRDQGFTIYFDRALYLDLQSPPPVVSPDWDFIALQPDPNLPDDGAFDALALVNAPQLDVGFRIDFIYLGAGTPGSQFFEVSEFDTQGNLERVLDSGFTQLIPEPGTGLSALATLALLFLRRLSDSHIRHKRH